MTNQERDDLLVDLARRVEQLEASGPGKRGPKTERAMTAEDAWRVKFGDLTVKTHNHKQAAAALDLSYGQVFSARNSYTFKHVKADWKPKGDEK